MSYEAIYVTALGAIIDVVEKPHEWFPEEKAKIDSGEFSVIDVPKVICDKYSGKIDLVVSNYSIVTGQFVEKGE